MKKRIVTIATIDDDEVVRYRQTDDCYVCSYDTGDKFATHNCRLTDEFLGHSGKYDIDVPDTCPFPAVGIGTDSVSEGIINRYPEITEKNLQEITGYIERNAEDPGLQEKKRQ